MKKIIHTILFLLTVVLIFSQNSEEKETLIFQNYEKSVVYIFQSFYLNSSNVKNKDIFRKIEKEYEIEILDFHFTISSGTGFFISDDGYILTNYHVVKHDEIKKLRSQIYYNMIGAFFSKIPRSIVSKEEYDLLIKDLKNLLDNSEFHYMILLDNENKYNVELVEKNAENDIALMKLFTNKKVNSIPMGDSDLLKVGNFVMTIGYPVPSDLFYAVKDFKSTLTSGRVSAIRSDNWGIQHTSAISPGNSGGPLFNKYGEVIGINVGAVTSGNDIFFSIPINKAKEWLSNSEQLKIIAKNERTSLQLGLNYKLNKDGNLETGRMVLINLPKGYNVYLNGKYKGKTPLLLDNLSYGKSELFVKSDTEYKSQKIYVKKDIKETFTYRPVMKKYSGKLYIISEPLGAEVYIDGNKEGITPLVLDEIIIGEHKIVLKDDKHLDIEYQIKIEKGKMKKVNIKLEPGFKLIFKEELPKNTTILINNSKEELIFNEKDTIKLKKGKWNVSIKNESFKKESFEIEIIDKDIINDKQLIKLRSSIKFFDLKEESRVFIDNIDVTDKIENNILSYEIGEHTLKVKTKSYKSFVEKVDLEKEKELKIAVKYEITANIYKRKAMKLLIPGATLFGTGVLMFSITLSLNLLSHGFIDDYNNYVIFKYGSFSAFLVGMTITTVGLIVGCVSIPFFVKAYKKKKQTYFQIRMNNNIQVSYNLRF